MNVPQHAHERENGPPKLRLIFISSCMNRFSLVHGYL